MLNDICDYVKLNLSVETLRTPRILLKIITPIVKSYVNLAYLRAIPWNMRRENIESNPSSSFSG